MATVFVAEEGRREKLPWPYILPVLLPLLVIVSSTLAMCDSFSGRASLGCSIAVLGLLAGFGYRSFDWRWRPRASRWVTLTSCLIVFAGAIRVKPRLYLSEGQDPGVNIVLSKHIQDSGSYFLSDHPTVRLLSPDAAKLYAKWSNSLARDLLIDQGRVYIGFYPGHPSLMAVFGDLLGDDQRVWSLWLASLLSILAFGFFIRDLRASPDSDTKANELGGLVLMAILAVHPLHYFLSRFPCSEIIALACLGWALAYFAAYLRSLRSGLQHPVLLALATLSWTAVTFVRLNSILFAPFIILLLIGALLFENDRATRKSLALGMTTLLVAFFGACLFYEIYMPTVFETILEQYIFAVIGQEAYGRLAAVIVIGVLAVLALAFGRESWRSRARLVIDHRHTRSVGLTVLFLLFAVNAVKYNWKVYDDSWVKAYLQRNATLSGWKRIALLQAWQFFLYMSPLGFIAFAWALWRWRHTEQRAVFLVGVVGLTFTLAIMWLHMPLVYGGFYYNRYLLTEALPFSLSFLCLVLFGDKGWWARRWKLGYCSLVLTLLYFGYYTNLQRQEGPEGPDPTFFQEIAARIPEDGILVVINGPGEVLYFNEVASSMRLYFHKHVVRVPSLAALMAGAGPEVLAPFREVFVLDRTGLQSPFVTPDTKYRFRFNIYYPGAGHIYLPWLASTGGFVPARGYREIGIPSKHGVIDEPYWLYRLDKSKFAAAVSATKAASTN